MVATALLHGLLLLLEVGVVGEGSLCLVVPVLPILYFTQSRLEDAVDAIVLDLEVVYLGLVVVELVLHVLVLGKLGLPLTHFLLPLVNLVQLAPQDAVQPVQFLRGQIEFVAQFFVVVLQFLPADNFLLEATGTCLPIFSLLDLGIQGLPELLAFKLPLPLLLQLLVEPVLFLLLPMQLLILILQDFVEAQQLLIEKGEFVLVIIDQILVVAQLHDGDLVLLALLLVVINLPTPVLKQFAAFTNFVLKGRPFVLEADGHFSDFSVDHRLSLALHHVSEVFKLLGLALLSGLVASLPLLNLLGKVIGAVLLSLVLLLE